jgi:hypothetical protein
MEPAKVRPGDADKEQARIVFGVAPQWSGLGSAGDAGDGPVPARRAVAAMERPRFGRVTSHGERGSGTGDRAAMEST